MQACDTGHKRGRAALQAPSARSSIVCKPFLIYAQTLTGKTYEIRLPHSLSSIEQLKEAIEDREGLPPDQQRLMYAGRQLQEGRSLADYGITDQSTVQVVMSMKGC